MRLSYGGFLYHGNSIDTLTSRSAPRTKPKPSAAGLRRKGRRKERRWNFPGTYGNRGNGMQRVSSDATESFVSPAHSIRTVGASIARPQKTAGSNRRTANGRPYGCKLAASVKNAGFPPHPLRSAPSPPGEGLKKLSHPTSSLFPFPSPLRSPLRPTGPEWPPPRPGRRWT